MTPLTRSFSIPAAVLIGLVLAGCTGVTRQAASQAPLVATTTTTTAALAPATTQSVEPTPQQATASAVASTDLTGSIEPAAVSLLSEKDRNDASRAAFYALQFGRAGAPRTWAGTTGSGQITVGPEVQANSLTCRDFTHTVTVGANKYARKGTACREVGGTWSVVQSNPAA